MAKDVSLQDLSRQINAVNDGVIDLTLETKQRFDAVNDRMSDVSSDLKEIKQMLLESHEKRISVLEAKLRELSTR